MKYLKKYESFDFDDDGEDEENEPHSKEVKEEIESQLETVQKSKEEHGVFNLIHTKTNTTYRATISFHSVEKDYLEVAFTDIRILDDKFDEYYETPDYVTEHVMSEYYIQIFLEYFKENTNNVYFADKDSYNRFRLYMLDEGDGNILKNLHIDSLLKK